MAKAGDLYCNWRSFDDLGEYSCKDCCYRLFLRHRITCHASKGFSQVFHCCQSYSFYLPFVLRAIFFPGEQIIFEFGIIQVSVESILSGFKFLTLSGSDLWRGDIVQCHHTTKDFIVLH